MYVKTIFMSKQLLFETTIFSNEIIVDIKIKMNHSRFLEFVHYRLVRVYINRRSHEHSKSDKYASELKTCA